MFSEKNTSIGKKIKFGYLLLILLFFVMAAAFALTTLYFNNIYNEVVTGIIKSNQIQEFVKKDYDALNANIAQPQFNYDNSELFKSVKDNIDYLNLVLTGSNKEILNKIDSVSRMVDTYIQQSSKVVANRKENKPGTFGEISGAFDGCGVTRELIDAEVKELVSLQLNYSQTIMDKARLQSTLLIISIIVLFVLVLVFALVYSMRLSSSISVSAGILTKAARVLGDGDFSAKDISVNTNDELEILAGTFNIMKNNIRDISKRVVEASFVISSVSAELKRGLKTLYESSKQVSDAINDVASGTETQCADLSNSSILVEETYNLSNKLQGLMNNLGHSDSDINEQLKTIQSNLEKMNSSVKLISEHSTRFAANSEEIAAATVEQLGVHEALLNTATKLDSSSQEMDVLLKNLKTI